MRLCQCQYFMQYNAQATVLQYKTVRGVFTDSIVCIVYGQEELQ